MAALDGVHGTVCNELQYSQSISSSYSSNPSISCLTHGEAIGLALTAEASFLSFITVLGTYILIGWNVRWYRRNVPGDQWRLFQGPTDIYMFSLFAFDLLQAMGGILDVRWAHNGIVTTGPYCTAQGIVQQTGELGVALTTLVLAVHTFVAAMWRVGLQARGFAFGLVGIVCIFIALWVAIGASIHRNYETPTPYWCWLSPHYPAQRLAGEYIWMWVALFTSVLLYIPLYFWTEGRLSVDPERWYRFHTRNPRSGVEYAQRRASLGMLLYPVAYAFVVLPTSASRWSQFEHNNVPSAATFFGAALFNISGAINVLLLWVVRPNLLLLTRPEELEEPEIALSPVHAGAGVLSDTAKYQHSPEPSPAALADNNPPLSHVSSRPSI